MYEDDTGYLGAFVAGDRLYAHVELYKAKPELSDFKHWREVLGVFEDSLQARGISKFYSVVDSLDKFRWCEFLGMHSAYETYGDTIEIMVKDISNGR